MESANRRLRSAFYKLLFIHLGLFVSVVAAHAACETAWDGDKVVAAIAGKPAHLTVPLKDRQQRIVEVTVDQIQAFNEAKERLYRAAGLSPKFIICADAGANAFATVANNTDIVGVTAGMLRMVGGDRDMAAAVIGHELAHRTQRHNENAVLRGALIGLVGALLGAAVDARQQRRTGVYTGVGFQLGQLGATLVSRKFDRDQEREADDIGFQYLVMAGFDPNGTVRLAERMSRRGGGVGLFFDTHPGWSERTERFRTMIANSPQAQQLIERSTQPSAVSGIAAGRPSPEVQHRALSMEIAARSGEGAQASASETAASAGLAIRAGIANEYRDLMTAVMLSDKDAVADFLARGYDINELHKGTTYLIAAVLNRDLEMVQFLVSNGADVNRADSRGVTPLVYANSGGPESLVLSRFLEAAGARNPFASR